MGYIGPVAVAQLANSIHSHAWDPVLMVAISGAESGWNTTAISPTHDYGLWQINLSAHPQLFQQYTWWKPQDNLQMAFAVFRGAGPSAWTTYTSGAYQRYWAQAQAAVQQAGGTPFSGGSQPPSGAPPAADSIDATPEMWQTQAAIARTSVALDKWGTALRQLW